MPKIQAARDAIQAAANAAQSQVNRIEQAAANAKAILQARFSPQRPAKLSDELLLSVRKDVQDVLLADAGNNRENLALAVGRELRKALDTGNASVAWVLSAPETDAGSLALWLRSRGVNAEILQQVIAQESGRRQGSGVALPGAPLLAALSAGGQGSINGFCVTARAIIAQQVEAMGDWLASAALQVRNGPPAPNLR